MKMDSKSLDFKFAFVYVASDYNLLIDLALKVMGQALRVLVENTKH